MSDDRIGQPMTLSQLLLLVGKKAADTQLERGDITKEEHKERIKILFPDLELKKAGGGMIDINNMIRPIGYKNGGFENRLSMLRESMRDDEEKTMREPNITGVAFKIAEDQGDTSEENVNLIVKQLGALIPSLMKTVEDETTPMLSKGIRSLLDKLSVMFGQKSDPKERRDVGFGRVD